MRLYLDAPYREKEQAKALGAKWNPRVKKWYADTPPEEFVRFSKWILGDWEEVIIALHELFIIEGQRKCWKCKKNTRIVGLGIGGFVQIFDDGDGPQCDIVGNIIRTREGVAKEEVHLAWADEEEMIPPGLLRYLKENYSVKTGYSRKAGKTFANHCDCCGAIQGNWNVFNEPDSPLSSNLMWPDRDELENRMKKLKIKGIAIDDAIMVDWSMGFSPFDDAYMEYGQYEEIALRDGLSDEGVSYEELYSD